MASGATEAITYSVLTSRPGEFRLRPAEVTYVVGGETYAEVSDRPVMKTGPSGMVQAAFTLRGDLVRLIDLAAEGRGEMVVTAAILVVGVLVLLNLALTVRKWRLGAAPPL